MASIFTRIIQGEIPSFKIAENDNFFAFLDVFPLAEGHTLVVPKMEVDDIHDLDPELYKNLFSFSQTVATAIKKSIPCRKVGVAVVGLEVPHAHIHLIPINNVGDMNFSREKSKADDARLADVSSRIIAAL
ncbi:MAG: HIT family protein [Bacteroidia bacterium]